MNALDGANVLDRSSEPYQETANRETAQNVAASMVKFYERELRAWKYIAQAMEQMKPTPQEEEGLLKMLSRARSTRSY